MNHPKRNNILAIICGIWFCITGILWTYWICLIIAYPVGLLGFYFWYRASKAGSTVLNRIALSILIAGLVCSLGALWLFR